jgi:cysteinyl-tRNA synthetase
MAGWEMGDIILRQNKTNNASIVIDIGLFSSLFRGYNLANKIKFIGVNMAIRVYNTISKSVDDFQPIQENKVNFFVCGPTVYDFSHLGHAKTYTQFDFIVKYLRWRGYDVFYLQNITDLDDKIIKRSQEKGIGWQDLARQFETCYVEDMKALHNTAVNKFARATDYIQAIITQVDTLMKKGYAYTTSDGVYYEISKFDEYGKLSGRTEIGEEDSVSRIDESSEKRGWNDFCLWKASKPGEPTWESPFGPGRPGWHIEDTAITETIFGPQYDIHGGAIDLIFPHHEAEIAQMQAASGRKPLVRYWLHTGFLNINAQKMSKSLGNFRTIRDVLKIYDYRTLRYFFISSHYRTTIEFNETVLDQAKNSIKRIDEFVFNLDPNYEDVEDEGAVNDLKSKVIEALDEDFNTPRALAAIFDFMRVQNAKGKSGKRAYALFHELNHFLEFMNFEGDDLESEVQALIDQRQASRAQKDFKKADEIRDQLTVMGIQLYDTKEGVKWRKVS